MVWYLSGRAVSVKAVVAPWQFAVVSVEVVVVGRSSSAPGGGCRL